LIWQPSRTQSYYVSWGNSYNPSGELGVYGGTANTSLSPSNEDLSPEKNSNVEVGAQWQLASGLQLRTAVFRTEKTNGRLQDLDTGFTVLAGKRRVDGVEADLTGRITPDWDLYASVAAMDGKIVTGSPNVQGNTPLGLARVAGSLWSVYRLGHGWEVGGGVRGQTGTWLTDTNLPGSRIPAYAILDATLAYVTDRYEVRLNLYNLTDRQYFIGGYQNAPNRVLPGAPFSGAVTVRFTY
jgi:catecholate siderophore receptor